MVEVTDLRLKEKLQAVATANLFGEVFLSESTCDPRVRAIIASDMKFNMELAMVANQIPLAI
jgi:alkylhydroperoxidase/carboxymuconolactone decarboxylase family protein YurZ